MRDWAREKSCRLIIVQNGTGCTFRPNNEYSKWSRAKIIKGVITGGVGILAYAIGSAKRVAVLESHEIALVAYSSQITPVGSDRERK